MSRHRLPDSLTLRLERLLETDLPLADKEFIHSALDGSVSHQEASSFLQRTGNNLVDLRGEPISVSVPEPVEPQVQSSRRVGSKVVAFVGVLVFLFLGLGLFLLQSEEAQDPNEAVTRREFLFALIEALRISGLGPDGRPVQWPSNCSTTVFEDITDDHRLAQDCRIAYAMEQRILEGNRQGKTLDLSTYVKRMEAARLLVLATPNMRRYYDRTFREYEEACHFRYECTNIGAVTQREEFYDVLGPTTYGRNGWYYYYVYTITEFGLMMPRTSFRFDPKGLVTRAEMQQWICESLPKSC